MRVISVESTELFTGTEDRPRQVVAVDVEHAPGRPVRLSVVGPGVRGTGETVVTVGDDGTVRAEVSVAVDGLAPGDRREITVTAVDADLTARRMLPCSLWSAWSVPSRVKWRRAVNCRQHPGPGRVQP